MKSIVLNLMIFSMLWSQHMVFSESKVKLELLYPQHGPMTKFGFQEILQEPRLKKHLNAYFSKRLSFPEQSIPIRSTTIVQNEFITNANGEYSFNYELRYTHSNLTMLRRAETGTFEKADNGVLFVVRGLFYWKEVLWVYKSSGGEFFLKPYEPVNKPATVELSAKTIACGCCINYRTCSSMCYSTPPPKLCPTILQSLNNVPVIKEQTFNIYRNNSYELRIFFENNFYNRVEFFDFIDGTDSPYIFGYFPDPDSPTEELQYYFESERYQMYVRPEFFPDTCICEGALGIRGTDLTEGDAVYIARDVLKTLVG